MKAQTIRTRQEVQAELVRRGEPVSHWARRNGVDPEIARAVLRGSVKGNRGEAHKIAVLLGLKDGEIVQECSHANA